MGNVTIFTCWQHGKWELLVSLACVNKSGSMYLYLVACGTRKLKTNTVLRLQKCISFDSSKADLKGTRGTDKSLARPNSRCRRTESIASVESGVCSCAELSFLVTEIERSMSGDARNFNLETRALIIFFFCCKTRQLIIFKPF